MHDRDGEQDDETGPEPDVVERRLVELEALCEPAPVDAMAEELGFDHGWTYDHLTWRTFRDSTWFAAVPQLAAAAMVTERVRIGTLVASPNFRHPVPFAKDLITLDDLTEITS